MKYLKSKNFYLNKLEQNDFVNIDVYKIQKTSYSLDKCSIRKYEKRNKKNNKVTGPCVTVLYNKTFDECLEYVKERVIDK